MKKRFLRLKTAMRAVMLILMMGVVGVTEGQESKANITFADANVKALCVANWDTNGDGELSYAEAAAVTDLGKIFKNNTAITSFNELQYFTGLTAIGNEAFFDCKNITSIIIPNTVTSIGYSAFYDCGLTGTLSIPNSVITIGGGAFQGCSKFSTLVIGNSVTTISSSAFRNCRGLTSLTFGNSVTTIGNDAFYYCDNLAVDLIIPSSVTSIGNEAFLFCKSITSVTIPSSVTTIGQKAFSACDNLTTITFNATNCTINGGLNANEHWLYNCPSLANITIGGNVEVIPNYFISRCSGISSVIIPNSVTSIGYHSFYACAGMTSLTIGSSVSSIGDYAFWFCSSLSSMSVKASTPPTTAESTFTGVDKSIPVYIPCGTSATYNSASWGGFTDFQEICQIDFADANVKALCVANWDTNGDGELSYAEAAAVTDLGEVFKDSTAITSFNELQYFTGLTAIGNNAFYYCTSLSSITIPNTVKSIGLCAFDRCTGLKSVEIPNSVTSIGDAAFSYCTGLTSLTIGNSVESIGGHAFYNCHSVTSLTIPNSVKSIGDGAFGYCEGLTSLTIPYSVTSIGNSAFYGCAGLTSLTFPYSVTSIGNSAFAACKSLTSLTIPNSVTSIGEYAFAGCTGLTSLTIGNSVTSIGDHAFENCSNIESMTVLTEKPQTIYSSTFSNVPKNIPVYVSDVSSYHAASYWSDFTNYQEMGMANVPITGYGSSNDSDHWVFIASPLASSVLPTDVYGLVADPYDLYRFNQLGNITDGEWENYKNQENTEGFVLENGKGYLYANKNNVTLTFAGAMNMTDSQEVELDYDSTANLSGWNLIGNPFTVDAYINRPYYKMNTKGTDVEPVETFGATPVAAYSGIMVHADYSGDPVTFTKSGSKSSDNGGLQITLSKAGVRGDEAQDKVIVSFNKYAQLSKFIFNEDNAKLYIPMGGEDYAIAYSDRQSNMPLYFKTKEMGIYTMSFEGAIDNIKIIDNLDGSVIDLNAEKSFTFVGTPSDRNDRFTIVFNTPATEDFAYQSGDGIVVNGEGELQVFDIMGRMVAKYHVNGVETVNIPCQSGVYVLRLLGKETNTQKIVIK